MSEEPLPPYGGELRQLLVSPARAAELTQASLDWPSWQLSRLQLAEAELLLTGACSPLTGYLGAADYASVSADGMLQDGRRWPVPLTLDVPELVADRVGTGSVLGLRDLEGVLLAALFVDDVYRPDATIATAAPATPPAATESSPEARHPVCLGGRLEGLRLPLHYDYRQHRLTPAELRAEFARRGWRSVLGAPISDVPDRLQLAGLLAAAADNDVSGVVLHLLVGDTDAGDRRHHGRVRAIKALLAELPPDRAMLSLLPLARPVARARRDRWYAVVERNYGLTHVVVDDHRDADPGNLSFAEMVPVVPPRMRYDSGAGDYVSAPAGGATVGDGGTDLPADMPADLPADPSTDRSRGELRRRLLTGEEIPAWLAPPAVVSELVRLYPPRRQQGFTVFFTGFSGSGKSTIANALLIRLLEEDQRRVTLLDGDVVRTHLTAGLGFSKADRDINVRRIGWVAAQITGNAGAAIAAPIAPYDQTRRAVREMVEREGGFVLVHVATPLEVCEERDRKGLYRKARAGLIPEFTGVSDPYEVPTDAEVVLATAERSADESAEMVVDWLRTAGYLAPLQDGQR